jgi:excisionase family DNA binding protein
MVRRSFLTTFEISQLCEVNPTTVQNWVKEGKLKAHVTPGGHRRIRREDLISFMKEFGLPIPAELCEAPPLMLIVDDDEPTLELLSIAMESGDEAFEVMTARDGIEALLMIGERKPDLLIVDIMLPGMDGFGVCRKLKASDKTRNIKIVAITGNPDPALKNQIIEAGADRFFAKPFEADEFRQECLKLLHS